jgi:enoyl-CoA hydratase/carnithine racemase
MNEFDTIEFEVRDHVASVMLNRPAAMNSFNLRMCQEFSTVWQQVRDDSEIHVVVLHAAGERAFSTGVDVKSGDFVSATNPWTEQTDPGKYLRPKANQVWKPVVAAVNGLCAGGAFYWIGEADIVLATPAAQFFDPHVSYGMVTALEPIMMRYRMPLSAILRMSIMGLAERVSAQTALTYGIVSEIAEADVLLERAFELAHTIAAQPPAAVQGSVKAIWQALDQGRNAALSSALMYTQLGNPIGTEQVERDSARRDWTLR